MIIISLQTTSRYFSNNAEGVHCVSPSDRCRFERNAPASSAGTIKELGRRAMANYLLTTACHQAILDRYFDDMDMSCSNRAVAVAKCDNCLGNSLDSHQAVPAPSPPSPSSIHIPIPVIPITPTQSAPELHAAIASILLRHRLLSRRGRYEGRPSNHIAQLHDPKESPPHIKITSRLQPTHSPLLWHYLDS
jgi:hypothetical protein